MPAYANPTAKYGGIWRFLTLQNFFLHLAVNTLFLVGEVIQPAKALGTIVHYGISFGTTWVVFLVFWPLYMFNQELILPKRNEAFYPFWMNWVEHGLIAPFALVNCLLEPRTGTRATYLSALVLFATGYVAWILHIYSHTGQWVYPFLAAAGYANVLRVVLPLTIGTCGVTALIGVRLNDAKFGKKHKLN